MKITLAQINPKLGDIKHNVKLITKVLIKNCIKTDLIVFPEMCLTGYTPKDILLFKEFKNEVLSGLVAIKKISKEYPNTGLIIGLPSYSTDKLKQKCLNSAYIIQNGKVVHKQHKTLYRNFTFFIFIITILIILYFIINYKFKK